MKETLAGRSALERVAIKSHGVVPILILQKNGILKVEPIRQAAVLLVGCVVIWMLRSEFPDA